FGSQCVDQRGLADPGVAADQREPPAPVAQALQRLLQGLQLALTAKEYRRVVGRVARSPDVAHGKPRSQARGAAGGDRCARILPYARGPIMAATEVNPRDFMALRNGKAGSRRRSAGAL